MNDNQLYHLFSKMKAERLSIAKRARLREQIVARIKQTSVPTYREFSFMRFMWVSGARRIYVSVLAVFIIVFGVGSYAAGGSLPGDALYAMKTNINEPIQRALAVSEKAKVNLEADLTERRLAEVSQLASEARLDPVTEEKLLNQATEHAVSLRTALTKSGDTLSEKEVNKLSSRLESSRKAHTAFAGNTRVNSQTEPSASAMPAAGITAMSASAPVAESAETTTTTVEVLNNEDGVVKDDFLQTTRTNLKRVDDEYEKSIQILDARRAKLSHKNSSESADVTNNKKDQKGSDNSSSNKENNRTRVQEEQTSEDK